MQPVETRILIVDDEDRIRELFTEVLQDAGYNCFPAGGGEEALAVLEHNPIDLILADILMPGMSGLTLFARVREVDPNVAVIFVTAMDDVDIAVKNLKDGAYDYLVKPVSTGRLLQAVGEVLEHRDVILDQERRRKLEEEEQSKKLDQRGRELAALNRLFQKHLAERFANEEAYRTLLTKVERMADDFSAIAEVARNTQLPQLSEPYGPDRKTTIL